MSILKRKLRIMRSNITKRFLTTVLLYVKKERNRLYFMVDSGDATEEEHKRWTELERHYNTISLLIYELDHIQKISKMED